jgi:non-ribosomal peptide synthetase component E (peptide arylation enzyme)
MSSCSYDVHVQEILGVLMVGSSIVMLHPGGNMDFDYLLNVISEKQVSYMQSIPSYLNNLLDILSKENCSKIQTLRTIDIGGMKISLRFQKFKCLFCR